MKIEQLSDEQLSKMIDIASKLKDPEHFQLICNAVDELYRMYYVNESLYNFQGSIIRSYLALRCNMQSVKKYLAPEFIKTLANELLALGEEEDNEETPTT